MRSSPLNIAAVIVGVILLGAVAIGATGPRPTMGNQDAYTRINGVPERASLADGGGAGVYVTDGGIGCQAVTGGSVIGVYCDVAAWWATSSSSSGIQDGGLTGTLNAVTLGVPLAATTFRPIILRETDQAWCAKPQSGATLNCPVWTLR